MYVLTAPFDPEQAKSKVSELLALYDAPDRLAEKLGIGHDIDLVKRGIEGQSFKRLVTEAERLRQFLDLEKQIDDVREGRWNWAFLGKGYAEKKLTKLNEERRKFGSLIEAPRWFYKQERVWLLGLIRDYALEGSQQGDAEWIETDHRPITFPIVNLFESGDFTKAKAMAMQLEKPLKDMDAKWILQEMEGHRALWFNFEKSVVVYYHPVRNAQ